MLDIARIEAGMLSISLEPVRIADVTADALALVQPLADRHSVELQAAVPPAELHVLADNQRLKQVMVNLAVNAIKYNRLGGSVKVTVTQRDENMVRIDITDTGVGIDPGSIDKLFAPFERLGATEVEGSGLGLALSKAIVEGMGGQIGVDTAVACSRSSGSAIGQRRLPKGCAAV